MKSYRNALTCWEEPMPISEVYPHALLVVHPKATMPVLTRVRAQIVLRHFGPFGSVIDSIAGRNPLSGLRL